MRIPWKKVTSSGTKPRTCTCNGCCTHTSLLETLSVNDVLVFTVQWSIPIAQCIRSPRHIQTLLNVELGNKIKLFWLLTYKLYVISTQDALYTITFQNSALTSFGTLPPSNRSWMVSMLSCEATAAFNASTLNKIIFIQTYLLNDSLSL